MDNRKYVKVFIGFFVAVIGLSIIVGSSWNLIDDWNMLFYVSGKSAIKSIIKSASSSNVGRWFPAYWLYYKVISLFGNTALVFYIFNALLFASCVLLLQQIGKVFNVSKKYIYLLLFILIINIGFADAFYTLGKSEARICVLWLLVAWLLSNIMRATKLGKIEALYYIGIFVSLLLSALTKEHTIIFMGGLIIGFSIIWFIARGKDPFTAKKSLILSGTILIDFLIYVPLFIINTNIIGNQRSYHHFSTGLVLNAILNLARYTYYHGLLLVCFVILTVLIIAKIRAKKTETFLFTVPLWFGAAGMILFLVIYPKANTHYPFPIYAIVLPAVLVFAEDLRLHYSSLQKAKQVLITVFLLLLVYNGTAQAFNRALFHKLNSHAFTSFLNWSRDNMPKNATVYIFQADRGASVERFASLNFYLNQWVGKNVEFRADQPVTNEYIFQMHNDVLRGISDKLANKDVFDSSHISGSFVVNFVDQQVDSTVLRKPNEYELKMRKIYKPTVLPEPARILLSKRYNKPGVEVYQRQ